jgi:hypothetical protein
MMTVRKAQHVQWSSCYWPKVPQQQVAAKQGCHGGSAVRTCCCCTSFFQTDLGGGGRLCSLPSGPVVTRVATAATSKGSAQLAGSFVASLNVPTTCCHKLTTLVPMTARQKRGLERNVREKDQQGVLLRCDLHLSVGRLLLEPDVKPRQPLRPTTPDDNCAGRFFYQINFLHPS